MRRPTPRLENTSRPSPPRLTSIFRPIGKAVGREGLPLSNLTIRLKPTRPYAASTISSSKAGHWRSTKRVPERIALVPGKTRQLRLLAQKGLTDQTSPTRQGAAVVQVASSVRTHRRGGTANGRIAL